MNKLLHIKNIAKKLNLKESQLEYYGKYKAKINNIELSRKGKLILVTAITPTKYGEGKTTVSIGLADGLTLLGEKACLALREPSLGPVFGIKGGATGGGKSLVEPSDEINLHFTGDFHAITSANNLLCALIDNHIFQGNQLKIDTNQILFHRCEDMNDRALREITISQEKLKNNRERKESFTITAASEIMALLCLAKDLDDLKTRLGNIIVAFNYDGKPVYAKELKAENAMAILLKEAIKPNLVQTLAHTPAIIHGGPFANIAHGCNSIIATNYVLSVSDYCITEAGFGADLGGEKFLDLKCRVGNFDPNLVVLVATVRALKSHSPEENNVEAGFDNLGKHIDNLKNIYNKEVLVAINYFKDDDENDIDKVKAFCAKKGVEAVVCSPYLDGGEGCTQLASKAIALCQKPLKKLTFAYELSDNIKTKIVKIAEKVYGAKKVEFSEKAEEKIAQYQPLALNMPIVVAKTQYSLLDDEKNESDGTFHIRDIEIKNGAGFIVALAGKISLMPGLPKEPNSSRMTIDKQGNIENLH